jgi:plasmid stability protein
MVGNLTVRRLDKETLERLRLRAAEHGVSMEEEARRILAEAVSTPRQLGDMAVSLFGAVGGVELESPEKQAHEHPSPFR